ncbi:hypothetical protein HZS_4241 [Henneguya salminicola]|nr:hypothetical protein HZS_4241 [Henneguya salminicola]
MDCVSFIIIKSNANASRGTEENIVNNFTVKTIATKMDIVFLQTNVHAIIHIEENIATNTPAHSSTYKIAKTIACAIILTILINVIAQILYMRENIAIKLHVKIYAHKENAFIFIIKKYHSACVMTSRQEKNAVYAIILTVIDIINQNILKNKISNSSTFNEIFKLWRLETAPNY